MTGKRVVNATGVHPSGDLDRNQISAKLDKGVLCIAMRKTAKPGKRFARIRVHCPATA